jgi:hypothetical protein
VPEGDSVRILSGYLRVFDTQRRYEKTPHACFGIEPPLTKVEGGLPRLLEFHLRARFKPFRLRKMWFLGTWAGVVPGERDSHGVAFGKSRYKKDDWVLVVSPPSTATLLDRVLGRRVVSDVADVMLLCRDIHALLTTIEGITAVRWYFEGPRSQTAAVTTPDELPWGLEV